jgi:putative oxidoreductase
MALGEEDGNNQSKLISMKKLLHLLTTTTTATAPLLLRLTLALVFFPHGAQKVLGWFGGYGFTGTMGFFTGTMGIPYFLALLTIATEFLAPFAFIAGFFTRIAALALGVEMVVAVLMVHQANGFFMNWTGKQAGEGFEYHLLVIGMAIALIIAGSGRFSVDRAIADKTAASE